jgi:hypothetical protein
VVVVPPPHGVTPARDDPAGDPVMARRIRPWKRRNERGVPHGRDDEGRGLARGMS